MWVSELQDHPKHLSFFCLLWQRSALHANYVRDVFCHTMQCHWICFSFPAQQDFVVTSRGCQTA